MNSDGALGEAPDWYIHLRAARYLGVAPWDLSERAVFWRNAALTAESVENEYQEAEQQRQSRG